MDPIRFAQYIKVFLSYLFIGESIQILMIVAEEKISQNGLPVTHSYILILQCGLDDGVHQDLKRSGGRTVNDLFNTRVTVEDNTQSLKALSDKEIADIVKIIADIQPNCPTHLTFNSVLTVIK